MHFLTIDFLALFSLATVGGLAFSKRPLTTTRSLALIATATIIITTILVHLAVGTDIFQH